MAYNGKILHKDRVVNCLSYYEIIFSPNWVERKFMVYQSEGIYVLRDRKTHKIVHRFNQEEFDNFLFRRRDDYVL